MLEMLFFYVLLPIHMHDFALGRGPRQQGIVGRDLGRGEGRGHVAQARFQRGEVGTGHAG